MDKIKDILEKKTIYSFELFPPKTEEGYQKLLNTINDLCQLKPDYISCTYGAGGGGREKTFDIVQYIEQKHKVTGMAHLTCVLNTKEDIRNILDNVRNRGIGNILALRGDPPKDNPHWQPTDQNFKYSSELVAFIRAQHKNYFGIAVAGFPEGHILCKDKELDANYLKLKIEQGADFVITQLFFNNQDYFDYVQRLKKIGVTVPVIPGILPITDYLSLTKFCALCGATIPQQMKKIFEPIANDPQATLDAGIEFTVRQCQSLLSGGAPGLHFYCLNKLSPTDKILSAVRR